MKQFTSKLKDLKPIIKLNTISKTLMLNEGKALAFSPYLLASIPCPTFDKPFLLDLAAMEFLPHLAKYRSYELNLLDCGLNTSDLGSDEVKLLAGFDALLKFPTLDFNADGGLSVNAKLLKLLINAVSQTTNERLTFDRSGNTLRVSSVANSAFGLLAPCKMSYQYCGAKDLQAMLKLLPTAKQATRYNPCTIAHRQVGDTIVYFATNGGYLAKLELPVGYDQSFDGDRYVNNQAKAVPIADGGLSFSDIKSLHESFKPINRDSVVCTTKNLLKVLDLFGDKTMRLSVMGSKVNSVMHITDGNKISAIVMAY